MPCRRCVPAAAAPEMAVMKPCSETVTAASRSQPPAVSTESIWYVVMVDYTCIGRLVARRHVHATAGTFDGAIPHLAELAELGVTAIEIMPVAEFPGHRGWGYDGVYLSAAQSSYGGPQGLLALVDAAHDAGLAVILDVVYNHVGASGSTALEAFGPYFTDKYATPWGSAINYDDADCDPVREWVLQSATGGSATSASTACASTPSTRSSTRAPSTSSPRWRGASTRFATDALVIAESGLNDPRVMRDARASAAGAATRCGPTTSTTRCARS